MELYSEERFLRLPEVLEKVGLRRSYWYELIQKGKAPKPKKIGSRMSVWPLSEILDYMKQAVEIQ